MSVYDLTGFQRDLLFVVGGLSDPCGKEIKNQLEETQGRKLLAGRVYSNLDSLIEEGYVEKGSRDGRTNQYSITEAGERLLRERYQWQTDHFQPDEVCLTPAE